MLQTKEEINDFFILSKKSNTELVELCEKLELEPGKDRYHNLLKLCGLSKTQDNHIIALISNKTPEGGAYLKSVRSRFKGCGKMQFFCGELPFVFCTEEDINIIRTNGYYFKRVDLNQLNNHDFFFVIKEDKNNSWLMLVAQEKSSL